MNKKIIFILIVCLVALAGFFIYQKYLKGLWPAIGPVEESRYNQQETNKNQDSNINGEPTAINNTGIPLDLPSGFEMSVLADNLSGARDLAVDQDGNLWLSRTSVGIISKLTLDNNELIKSEDIFTGLSRPHGLAFNPDQLDELFIAEETKISKVAIDNLQTGLEKIIDLPKGGRHYTRSLVFGSDNRLYVSIGSSCDTCLETDSRIAKVFSLKTDGSDFKEVASGLRNAVFLARHPATGEVWATEMGRDFLGDDLPPDEINIIKEGKNYGWPYCYGDRVQDKKFNASKTAEEFCQTTEPAYLELQAHSAPLGLDFIPREGWSEKYQDDLLIGYHGSWNRSEPTGYKVMRIQLDENGNYQDGEDFISGWLSGNSSFGRPVDVLALKNGILYISDDKAGLVYQLKQLK